MVTLGSIGVFFSTIIRKTIVAMVCTYGVAFFLAAGTAIITMFTISFTSYGATGPQSNPIPYFIAMFNPFGVMLALFEPAANMELKNITGIDVHLGIGQLITFIVITVTLLFLVLESYVQI